MQPCRFEWRSPVIHNGEYPATKKCRLIEGHGGIHRDGTAYVAVGFESHVTHRWRELDPSEVWG